MDNSSYNFEGNDAPFYVPTLPQHQQSILAPALGHDEVWDWQPTSAPSTSFFAPESANDVAFDGQMPDWAQIDHSSSSSSALASADASGVPWQTPSLAANQPPGLAQDPADFDLSDWIRDDALALTPESEAGDG